MAAAATSVVYVLTTPILEYGENATVDQIKKRNKWNNDDYVCRGLILKGMFDPLFDIYQTVESKKRTMGFLGGQYNEPLNMDEAIQVSCIIDKLSLSWKDFKHTLKYKKEELTLVQLGSHLRIEESLKVQDNDKPKGNNVAGPYVLNNCGYKQVIESNKFVLSKHGVFIDFGYLSNQMFRLNIVNDNIASAFMSTSKLNDSILWHARLSHVHFKRMQDMCKDGLIPAFDMDTEKWNKKYFVTFINDALRFCYVYLLHSKDEALDKFKVFKTEVELQQGSLIKRFRTDRGVVRLTDPKLKILGERGIKCIFVGYDEHSKAFRDEVSNQHSHCFNVEDDPKIFDKAIKSQDVAFLKEAINDEMNSIIGNNTWVLADLPPCCKPLGCKWIFKRKLKVNGTIENFKARLVIQGFKQKSWIDYFDTYASVARISIIRLLIAMASIHNLIIHQMDMKTTFLNGYLDEEVYMNQPQGFIMLDNENKVCKLIKSLYGLKQAPKQWHQKFDEVVLSNGYLLKQVEKCVYSKFDETGKEVIICLYVDDILIFGTDHVQVDLTTEFLSSRFSMKDTGEADVILVSNPMDTSEKLITNNGQAVSQLDYSRASKKQTCITGSTMESGFVALAAASKEAEWLRNLILKITLWSKPIAPIFIRCDNAATLAKAYSHMYNGKSRHLCVRHRMIRELITNGVISIEFVRSQQN
ncbi:zinc finger, CCHC-type containing protein [Tanacetum coccineum]|uniref:Zinc finger, CCHC-type containing protein n=1 Tax=Tanacetum coccineum TaxID=301880 RepID=A0ABQ5FEF2_9ASTR